MLERRNDGRPERIDDPLEQKRGYHPRMAVDRVVLLRADAQVVGAMEIPLEDLGSGTYVMRVEARPRGGSTRRFTVRCPFSVFRREDADRHFQVTASIRAGLCVEIRWPGRAVRP